MSSITVNLDAQDSFQRVDKNLTVANMDTEYNIKGIQTDDDELKDFLFTLGCFKGEIITLISKLADNYIISVKDARYSIDSDLAKAIII